MDGDRELLSRFVARRDEAAFELLVQRHGPLVYGVCRRVLGLSHDAEDAAQAVFLVLARKASTLDSVRSLEAWLHRVAWTVAVNCRKSRSARQQHEQEAPMPAPRTSSENTQLEVLDQELNALPEKYRESIFLAHFRGLTQAEAALASGLKESTFSMRLAKARELLRQRLERHGVHLSLLALGEQLSSAARSTDVPGQLTAAVARRAAQFATQAKASGTSASLAEETLRAMSVAKYKLPVAALLCAAVLLVLFAARGNPGVRMAHADAPPKPPAAPRNEPPSPSIDPASPRVQRALNAPLDLVLRRDHLSEMLSMVSQLLPADAELRLRAPLSLQSGGSILLDGTWHATAVRTILDDLARKQGLQWRTVNDGVLIWRPLTEETRKTLSAQLATARQSGDAPAWSAAADTVLHGGDLELRREILLGLSDTHAEIVTAAKARAVRLAAEGSAIAFASEPAAGAGLLKWLEQTTDSSDEPPWSLVIDVCSTSAVKHLTALCNRLLDSKPTPEHMDAVARRLMFAFSALAHCSDPKNAGAAEEVLLRIDNVDLALDGLATLARGGNVRAVEICRALAVGKVDSSRWKHVTAYKDADEKILLALLRGRPNFDKAPGWWHTDPRVGPNAAINFKELEFDPLYQEPALVALARMRDEPTLKQLHSITSDTTRSTDARAQAFMLLADAGEKVSLQDVAKLTVLYQAFDSAGPGSAGLALTLLRSSTLSTEESKVLQGQLAEPLFALLRSLGGMMEVGKHTDFSPWLARLQGFDDPALLKLIQADLDLDDYHKIVSSGNWGGQYGFPIYERDCQALACMRTEAAAQVLLNHPPHWVQQPNAGFTFWYLALAESRDPKLVHFLMTRATDASKPFPAYALAALPYTRDPEALALVRREFPKLATSFDRGWLLTNLMQGAGEWAPRDVVECLSAAVDDPDANIRHDALFYLSRFCTAGMTGDAEFVNAGEAAAAKIDVCSRDTRREVRFAAVHAMWRPEWPDAWQKKFRVNLERLATQDPDAEIRVTAANGLLTSGRASGGREIVEAQSKTDRDEKVRQLLKALLARTQWSAETGWKADAKHDAVKKPAAEPF